MLTEDDYNHMGITGQVEAETGEEEKGRGSEMRGELMEVPEYCEVRDVRERI